MKSVTEERLHTDKEHYDPLMAGLEDAAAFVRGDKTRCKAVEYEKPVPEDERRTVREEIEEWSMNTSYSDSME